MSECPSKLNHLHEAQVLQLDVLDSLTAAQCTVLSKHKLIPISQLSVKFLCSPMHRREEDFLLR